MIPTKRLWALFAAGIPIAVISAVAGQGWVIYAYNGMLLVAAWITSRMSPDITHLRAVREFDPVLSVRAANRIRLRLVNDGVEPLRGRLRDEPPASFETEHCEFPLHLEAGAERTYSYDTIPPSRGADYFRGTFLRLACPLGLVERQLKLPTEQPVRVYPNVLALREFDLLKQKGKLRDLGIRVSRMRGLGSEFESLREYALGDDIRKVDWKATARRGKLIVRQYEQERNQPVLIAIDIGRRMLSEVNGVTKLDHVLDALLMLTHAASAAGDLVGLLVYSDRVHRYIPPRKGRNQMGFIIEAIHDLLADPVESDPMGAFAYLAARWKRRSLIVNFTDVETGEEGQRLASALGSLVRRHIVLTARIADPRLQELVEASPSRPETFFRKASALQFVDERREAGAALSAAGMHHLESEPQELASALVSFYFHVKEKSLL
ncbi:MAG: DUF58 domain-containing protein [Methanoregulaceae archaeon]|jgi:uncharacterized protein (DUF58 family)|nr:DUF58 domain-containing protein [Methanoregulaceae archaeon]